MKAGYSHMRCGLVGEHLGHSFSAIIHKEIADYSYELVELAEGEVEAFVKNGGFDAFNVTIPYKQTVLPFLDTVSPEAKRIGAVNTVVRRPDGRLFGYNTDYFGFDGMLQRLGVDVKGKKAVVLGSGGASLTACAVLRDRGVRELVVVGRRSENNYENLHLHADAEILVNTTPVGMYPNNGVAPVSLDQFPRCSAVLDVIYNPARTALLLEAEARGIPCINGLYMLVAQAVKAFEFFTGDEAEAGVIETVTASIDASTKNLILVGMPGCGKSTVGKLLAKKMGRPFFDADEEFTAVWGRTPAEVIQSEGEDRFRKMEHDILVALGKKSGTVIATGGGAVTREENYAPLHQNGVIVYLKRNLDKLSTKGRPLSQGNDLQALYDARKSAYERFADLSVQSTEVKEKTVQTILKRLTEGRDFYETIGD
ncbi:MAG: AAA family ATPase [Clostridia bacterium]|nr:AAA family ATPase [Clostridia bacterium]